MLRSLSFSLSHMLDGTPPFQNAQMLCVRVRFKRNLMNVMIFRSCHAFFFAPSPFPVE